MDRFLSQDVRNNSAWNQRFFVLSRCPNQEKLRNLDTEVDYTLNQIQIAPHNESSWNYLKGYFFSL